MSLAQRAYAETSRLSARITDELGTISILTEHEMSLVDGGVLAFAGFVRNRVRTDRGVSSQRVYEIECQDYTTSLGDDVVDGPAVGLRPVGCRRASDRSHRPGNARRPGALSACRRKRLHEQTIETKRRLRASR